MLRIPHYQLFRMDRQTCDINNPNRPKAGGGLCIYVQDEITVDTISLAHLNTSDGNMELQCIKLTPRNQKQYTIFNLYRPPNGNVSEFLSNLDDKLTDYIGLENNEIFLMGDFNLNYLDVNSINVNSLKSNMEVLGLSQIIDQPTRYSALNPPTLIDHLYTNSTTISNSGTFSLNISDHELIFITRKKCKIRKEKATFKGRSYRNYDKAQFQAKLRDNDWDEFYDLNDVDEAWDYMLDIVEESIDFFCPTKEIKIKKLKEKWVTQELLEFINDKDDLLRLAKRTNNIDDWNTARIARNLVAGMVRNAKKDFLQEEINQNFRCSFPK